MYRTAFDNGVTRLFHYQRYRSDNLINTVVNRVIRFGRASGFNDPWDCKPSFHVPDDPAELRKLVEFMRRSSEKHDPSLTAAQRATISENYLKHPTRLRDDMARNNARSWALLDEQYRIYCLSTKADSQLMWAHYGDNHRGVCLEFNARLLDFGQAIEVNYSAAYPRYSLADDDGLSPLHTKSADWSYEQEYRVIAQEASRATVAGTLMTNADLFQLSVGSLVSVVTGAAIADANLAELAGMIGGTGVIVRRATRIPHRYELSFDPPL
jgi:hypothetical protein